MDTWIMLWAVAMWTILIFLIGVVVGMWIGGDHNERLQRMVAFTGMPR